MPRFSANLGFLWIELPLLEAIERAANAGFKAVELHFPYATPALDVRSKCADLGIRLLGINTNVDLGPHGHFGLAALPGQQAEFRKLAQQAIDYARTSGATAINMMAGKLPQADYAAGRETLVENLKWAADQLDDDGPAIYIEPLNRKVAPDFFFSRVAQAAEVIDLVGSDRVKIMFDAYHVGMEGDGVIATLRQHWPMIGHIQIASVPDRQEPDEGTFDYRELFSALDELGYTGWIGCEYKPRSTVEEGLTWTEKLGVSL